MTGEKDRGKGLREDVGSHIIRRNPDSREGPVIYVFTNKMMADIDVFGA
jgi:hypothetical protein